MNGEPRPPVPVAVVSRPEAQLFVEPPFAPPHAGYELVEVALRNLGLDRGRVGTPEWNPLGDLIAAGDRVVIKANFGACQRLAGAMAGQRQACSVTHGAVLRPIVDYALRAAGPRGLVTLVDTPVDGESLEPVLHELGIEALLRHYRERGQPVDFFDLRRVQVVPRMVLDGVQRRGRSWELGLLVPRALPGDPRGSTVIDLGARSRFAPVDRRARRYRFHRADPYAPLPHHSGGAHQYSLPRTVLEADAILTVAKLKTDPQAGVALSLAAVLGLCNQPHWLPHYTAGTPWEDGDEYRTRPPLSVRLQSRLQRLPLLGAHALIARAASLQAPPDGTVRGHLLEGAWEGNDTLWRATLDLQDLVLHADRAGRVHDTPQRRYLAFLDGIIAGEGEGPRLATPRPGGLLGCSTDPALLDLVGVELMGFVPPCVPTVWQALARPLLPTSHRELLAPITDGPLPTSAFRPPTGWETLVAKPPA